MRKIFAILTVLLIASCTKSHDEVVVAMKAAQTTKISKEQALKNLYSELQLIDGETRAGGEQRKVKSIKPLTGAVTRSGNALDNDLLYIVEFEEGQGSAVVSADSRLEPVIAVLDSDVLTVEDFSGDDPDDTSVFVASMIEDYATTMSIITPIPLLPAPGHSVRDTIFRVHIHPFLTTKWSYDFPYNGGQATDPNPINRSHFTVAAAQLLKYYNAPSVIAGVNINWNLLDYVENKGTLTNNTLARLEVIKLMDLLEENNFVGLLEGAGFSKYDYRIPDNFMPDTVSITMIKESVQDRRPVHMSASVEEMGVHYYTWLVDGCLDYTARCITAVERMGNIGEDETVIEYLTTETEYDKIHCNFGRGGKCDGYYSYRVFNLGAPNYDIDESVGDQTHTMYEYWDEYTHKYKYNHHMLFFEKD